MVFYRRHLFINGSNIKIFNTYNMLSLTWNAFILQGILQIFSLECNQTNINKFNSNTMNHIILITKEPNYAYYKWF